MPLMPWLLVVLSLLLHANAITKLRWGGLHKLCGRIDAVLSHVTDAR
jgi:hypothetical protein